MTAPKNPPSTGKPVPGIPRAFRSVDWDLLSIIGAANVRSDLRAERARAIAFGILRALSSICHPEERSDEGSAVAFRPISGKLDLLASPTFTAKQKKRQPQILHYVQDDKRCTQGDLKCDRPGERRLTALLPPA
jgi:hypothetical protein